MKNFIILIVLVLIVFACSKNDEVKVELFSPEAFCYSLDSGWELNAAVNVKGFKQEEKNGIFESKISYSVDLMTPGNNIKSGIFKDVIDKKSNEKIMDIALECQVVLDSTYEKGDYTIIFNVKDELSGKTKDINKTFKVE
mgnify:FL=1